VSSLVSLQLRHHSEWSPWRHITLLSVLFAAGRPAHHNHSYNKCTIQVTKFCRASAKAVQIQIFLCTYSVITRHCEQKSSFMYCSTAHYSSKHLNKSIAAMFLVLYSQIQNYNLRSSLWFVSLPSPTYLTRHQTEILRIISLNRHVFINVCGMLKCEVFVRCRMYYVYLKFRGNW